MSLALGILLPRRVVLERIGVENCWLVCITIEHQITCHSITRIVAMKAVNLTAQSEWDSFGSFQI